MSDILKPRLTAPQFDHYVKISELPEQTEVTYQGRKAKFLGMTGAKITLKVGIRTVYVNAAGAGEIVGSFDQGSNE